MNERLSLPPFSPPIAAEDCVEVCLDTPPDHIFPENSSSAFDDSDEIDPSVDERPERTSTGPAFGRVRFGSVRLHVHPLTLGTNPSAQTGLPVELEWDAQETQRFASVQDFERDERFHPVPQEGDSTVHDPTISGPVGRLSAEKGQRLLVDVFAEVHRAIPSARLVIAGSGPDQSLI